MGSIRQVLVPEIGDFKDVPVIEVMVRQGDLVDVDDALITIESDKATIDVPAPFGGAVTQLKIKVGDRVSAGTPILEIEAADLPIAPVVALGSPDLEERAAETRAPLAGAPASPPAPPGRSAPAGPVESVDGPAGPTPHASPSVRRFARELGVGLGSVSGTGPQSRILKEDVQSFVRSFLARPGVSGIADGTPGSAHQTRIDFARFGPVERQPSPHATRGVRNGSAIPHAVQFDEADITRLDSFREEVGEAAAKEGIKLTLLAFLLKVSVAALKQYPIFNASLDGEDLVLKRHYHLGFAVETPGGPAAPVIRDVDQKGLFQIGRELGELTARAQAGQLTADDLEGASFTVSSLDGIGGTGFTPVIDAPDVAVLGVANSARRLVEVDGQIVPRLMLPLALSYDLRVIHGAAAARFTRAFAAMLEDVRRTCL